MRNRPAWICERCGKTFQRYQLIKDRPPRFCSRSCIWPVLEERMCRVCQQTLPMSAFKKQRAICKTCQIRTRPQAARQQWQKWSNRHPTRAAIVLRAKWTVRHALERGELTRSQHCEECGVVRSDIQSAHFDYSRPLEVRWLCRRCHTAWDTASPKSLLPDVSGLNTTQHQE